MVSFAGSRRGFVGSVRSTSTGRLSGSVRVIGVHAAIAKLAKVLVVADIGAEAITASSAASVVSKAKKLAPVASGALRGGIQMRRSGLFNYTVTASSRDGGADKEYAAHVEFGTYKMDAQPFLFPAMEGEVERAQSKLGVLARKLERL